MDEGGVGIGRGDVNVWVVGVRGEGSCKGAPVGVQVDVSGREDSAADHVEQGEVEWMT